MLLKITLTLVLTLANAAATTNPGELKNQTLDVNLETANLNFTYGYKIATEHGSQEKQEQRVGDYALGRYNIQGADSIQTVEYLADNLGYHPLIQYSNISPTSISSTRIAFGTDAVNALHNSQKDPQESLNQKQENESDKTQGTSTKNENLENTIFYPTPVPNQEEYNSPQELQNIIFVQQESPNTLYQQENGVYLVPQQHFMYAAPTPNMYLVQLSNNENFPNYKEDDLLNKNNANVKDEEHSYGNRINVKLDTKLGAQITENTRVPKSMENLVSGEDVLNINSYFNSKKSISSQNNGHIINLQNDPIIVLEESKDLYSTTQSTIETVNTEDNSSNSVTPRPVSNIFLAPITAGLRLSSSNEINQNSDIELEKNLHSYSENFNFKEQNALPVPEALIQHEPIVRGNSVNLDQKAHFTVYQPQIVLLPQNQNTKPEKDLAKQASQYYYLQDQHYNPEYKVQQEIFTAKPYPQKIIPIKPYIQSTPINDYSDYVAPIELKSNYYSQLYPGRSEEIKSEPHFSQQLGTHKETSSLTHANLGEIVTSSQFALKQEVSKVPYITKLLPQKSYKYKGTRPVFVPKLNPYYSSNLRYKNIYPSYAPRYADKYEQYRPVRPQRINYNPYIGVPLYSSQYSDLKAHPTTTISKARQPTSNIFQNDHQYVPKQRTARQSFGSNLRIEYGFMPPFLPSQEIDELGRPLEKNEE